MRERLRQYDMQKQRALLMTRLKSIQGMAPFLSRLLIAGACVLGASAAVGQGISSAENLLFLTNHIQTVRQPLSLTYSYKKESTSEASFDDEVHVDVRKIHSDKSAEVSMRFLSGERVLDIPVAADADGNPALLAFLERDIKEMKRLTGGSVNYFRKRIRMALAEAAEVKPVSFIYAGKQRTGQEVSIKPYVNDPLRDRFPKYVNKTYAFILSQEVPGGLYQICTSSNDVVEKTEAKGKPSIMETLTLVKDERLNTLASATNQMKK